MCRSLWSAGPTRAVDNLHLTGVVDPCQPSRRQKPWLEPPLSRPSRGCWRTTGSTENARRDSRVPRSAVSTRTGRATPSCPGCQRPPAPRCQSPPVTAHLTAARSTSPRNKRGLNPTRHAVLGLQPRLDHVELQRPDHADDRVAPAALRMEHLHQPFFFQLSHAVIELLVPGVVQPQAPEMLGGKLGICGKRTGRPLYSVSPMAKRPGLTSPTMSPAYASDVVSRSRPKMRY